jgi:hypothetical protein
MDFETNVAATSYQKNDCVSHAHEDELDALPNLMQGTSKRRKLENMSRAVSLCVSRCYCTDLAGQAGKERVCASESAAAGHRQEKSILYRRAAPACEVRVLGIGKARGGLQYDRGMPIWG